jgi:transposase-like protein/IS1 family transposase
MNCPTCQSEQIKKSGRDRKGHQRFACKLCGATFQEEREKPLGEMTLALDKAIMVLRLLVEGCSIRSAERLTGVHRDTIMGLLETVGEKCAILLAQKIQGLSVKEVQCDEIWGFVQMKEKTKRANGKDDDETIGDAWCYVAIERSSKLILAWHLGKRTMQDTVIFTENLAHAASGNFQINCDGFPCYKEAIEFSFGSAVDFAQIIKVFGLNEEGERRYSPSVVVDVKKIAVSGNPDLETATTSHIERQNLTIRMGMRRMTRLTNGFSKKQMNLRYAYALHFFYYNFMRVHSTLRCTPAQEAKVAFKIWTWDDLLTSDL